MSTTSSKTKDAPEESTEPQAPEGNAPAPVPPEEVEINVPEPEAGEESVDRGTYVSVAHTRNPDVEVPDDYIDASKMKKGKPVDVFQVISSNGAMAVRFDNNTALLDTEQARAFAGAVRGALGNVVT